MVSCYYFSIFFWLCKHDLDKDYNIIGVIDVNLDFSEKPKDLKLEDLPSQEKHDKGVKTQETKNQASKAKISETPKKPKNNYRVEGR